MQEIENLFFMCSLLGRLFIGFPINNCIQHQQDQPRLTSQPQITEHHKRSIANIAIQKLEYQRLMQSLADRQLSQLPIDQVLQAVSAKFLGATYREGLLDQGDLDQGDLDQGDNEELFASLTEFDCVLFVETVLAFSRNLLSPNPSYENFVGNIQTVRYADGILDGYCSRLHYFSAWIRDNQKRNIVRDRTAELGGIPLDKTLNFMSSNWQKYPRIKNNQANHQCIFAMEEKMALEMRSQPLRYIPTSQISSLYPLLKAGDIIAIATDIQGLDTTHTGLVYPTSNGIGIIHASPSGKVKVSPDLQRYVAGVDQAIGIMVARPNHP